MIKGVNWIDLNQKHRDKQKRFDKLSNKEKAKIIGEHINYIGRTEGTENNGEHSLFGTLQNNENVYQMSKKEILDNIKSKVMAGAYVYKTIISMTEEEAKKYGYVDRESFENLIRQNLPTICNEYNIKFEDLDWVASLHTEEGHIHVHLAFYDNNNLRKIEPFVRYYNIKGELNKTVYKQTLEELYDIQNTTKAKIIDDVRKEIKAMYPSEKNEIFNNKIPKPKLNDISKLLLELHKLKEKEYRETGKGSWKMQYQTVTVKSFIRNIANKIIGASTTIQNTIDLYVKSNVEIEKIKNGNATNKKAMQSYQKVREKSTEFMMKKVDNQILNYLKNVQKEKFNRDKLEKSEIYQDRIKEKQIERIINFRLHSLFYNINQELKHENEIQNGYEQRTYILNQTKRARKEEALRNRDIGFINWQEK